MNGWPYLHISPVKMRLITQPGSMANISERAKIRLWERRFNKQRTQKSRLWPWRTGVGRTYVF